MTNFCVQNAFTSGRIWCDGCSEGKALIFSSFFSDPRTLQQQQSWTNIPNQSRSFRVLQKITDTQADDENGTQNEPVDDQPPQLQQAQFSRPLQYTDMNENQLRRLQLNEHDRALMNRVKNQGKSLSPARWPFCFALFSVE
jgi:hypothetical protein